MKKQLLQQHNMAIKEVLEVTNMLYFEEGIYAIKSYFCNSERRQAAVGPRQYPYQR